LNIWHVQQNNKAEKEFDGLYNRGNVMMNVANIPRLERFRVFHEVFKCVTHLDNLTLVTLDGKTAVGAGINCGFTNMNELHVMKYNEAMSKDGKPEWEKAADEENNRLWDY
jgi:hypothetical protein